MNSNFGGKIPANKNAERIQKLIDSGNRSEFALSLIKQFKKKGNLSEKQWAFVDKLANQGSPKEQAEKFKSENKGVFAWLQAHSSSNSFAGSLFDQLLERGTLSENQIAAVRRNIEKSDRVGNSNVVVANVVARIDALKAQGLSKIAVTVGGYKIYTPDNGGDQLYIKIGGRYIGKLVEGVFKPAGAAQKVDAENLVAIAKLNDEELIARIVEEGKKTGTCGICSRTLTDPDSIAAGIGPVCAGRVGF